MMIMQKVSIKLSNATIQTNGPLWEPAEWLGTKCSSPEVTDTVMIPPGTPYECTVDEACGLLRRWGSPKTHRKTALMPSPLMMRNRLRNIRLVS
jgi:hypothetical protein